MPLVDLIDIPCSGFFADDTDFAALFSRTGQTTQDLIINEVVNRCIEAEIVPEAGIFCGVTIIGHSDRDDTPGRTPEERRDNELFNSFERAERAQDPWLFTQFADALQAADATVPVDWASAQNVRVTTVACGAAHLVNKVPGNDEGLRQENRRVEFLRFFFRPETPIL